MDTKAKKILKKYKAYKQTLTEEEMQYGIRHGVLFPSGRMSHKEVVTQVRQLADEILLEDTVRAFLHSLSTGKNQYRTALASLLYAKALPEHEPVLYGRYERDQRCAYCGLKMSGEQMEVEIKNSDYQAYRYFPDGYQDICRADYVLFDLQQFQMLPKVDFVKEDILIVNRIFGLAEELAAGNKIIALQKLITAEKVLQANKNEIYVILGVLAACGAFDTPEHKGYAKGFVMDKDKEFVYEYDLFYPLNFWRGKHGIDYSAVRNIFEKVTGDFLDEKHTIRGEVNREVGTNTKKKSKAEQYFKDGECCIRLTNEQRYYYGLSPVNESWEKVVRFSVTHTLCKRSIIFFEGNIIKKMIFEEKYIGEGNKPVPKIYYLEFDMEEQTENQTLLLPKTGRGKKKPWTPSGLMVPTYMREQLHVSLRDDTHCVSSFNSQNDQYLPLPKGTVQSAEDFEKYTEKYIRSLPKDYDHVIADFHEKKRIRVKLRAGDIFRVALSPTTYTYALILGIAREVIKWDRIPKSHPMHGMMAQPILFRQYQIVTENKNMTPEELEDIPMYPMGMAQDNEVLWGTYPIIGRKRLAEKDIDLGFACSKKSGEVYWGFSYFSVNPDIYQDMFEGYHGDWMVHGFRTSLGISIHEEMSEVITRQMELRRRVLEELGMPKDATLDDIASRFGGPTRADYIEWVYGGERWK